MLIKVTISVFSTKISILVWSMLFVITMCLDHHICLSKLTHSGGCRPRLTGWAKLGEIWQLNFWIWILQAKENYVRIQHSMKVWTPLRLFCSERFLFSCGFAHSLFFAHFLLIFCSFLFSYVFAHFWSFCSFRI